MSEQKYFVLKELEIPLTDIEKGDIFRASGDPNQWWRAIGNGDAEPVSFVRTIHNDEIKTNGIPKSYEKLLGERNGQPRKSE